MILQILRTSKFHNEETDRRTELNWLIQNVSGTIPISTGELKGMIS